MCTYIKKGTEDLIQSAIAYEVNCGGIKGKDISHIMKNDLK